MGLKGVWSKASLNIKTEIQLGHENFINKLEDTCKCHILHSLMKKKLLCLPEALVLPNIVPASVSVSLGGRHLFIYLFRYFKLTTV